MSIESDRKRLSQKHNLEWIGRKLKATEMVTVYWCPQENIKKGCFIYGGLIPRKLVAEILAGEHISDVIENVWPEPAAYPTSEKSEIEYFRWGVDEDMYGSEPLVIKRQFSGMKENYIEILEEFRLFHNLYYEKKTDEYIKVDEVGNEKIVAIVKPDEVQIRLKEIRQFLAVKEMYLSMLFQFEEYSVYSIEDIGLSMVEPEFKRDGLICWRHGYCDYIPHKALLSGSWLEGFSSGSWLKGRKIVEPLPKSKSGLGDFAEKRKYVKFTVDTDENGENICHTCDPSELSDFPRESAAWKLTLVHFNRQVLNKYFDEPSKYYVRDSMVGCGMWSMRIDNHDPHKVCVFLDDLGISLPHAEQEHWRTHNIPPEGSMSETFYRRMVKGEWANSDQPDHLFKQSYEQLRKACDECLDWQLLKPLSSGDDYRLQRLRIFAVDEESHFKDSILDLANILIERLNEECLEVLLPVSKRKDIKRGINRLEYVLDFRKVEGVEKHIIFLRCLWDLRNTRGGSHPELLEDSRYKRAAAHFDLENLNRPEAFAKILEEAVEFLDFLIAVVQNGKLSDKNGGDC